jgi:hypothetical protein
VLVIRAVRPILHFTHKRKCDTTAPRVLPHSKVKDVNPSMAG